VSQQSALAAAQSGTEPAKAGRLFSGWTPEEVDLARRTVAPDATEHELALFLRLCKTYALDPFRKELVLEKRRRRRGDGSGYDIVPVFITTRDGYLKVAQRDPCYGGLQSGVVREGDDFEFDVEACRVKHRFGAQRGKIIGAWAIVKHAQRPPFMAYVEFSEYNNAESDTWKKHPAAMIQKVAEVFVLRRQFGITGIVTREEMSRELTAEAAALPTEHKHPEILASAEETVDVPAVRNDRMTSVATGPGTEDSDGSVAMPTATNFWRAVRAAAARSGEEAQAYVRSRSGGETDLRKLPPAVAVQIYREALAAIQSDGTAPSAPAGASPVQSTPTTRGKLTRDHTEFWRQVNEAARVEGDPDGAAWLARVAGGVTDSRQLDDATFTGLLAVARRVAGGEARTKDPEGGPTPQVHAEEASKTPQSPVTNGAGARPVTRDQVREIQRIWRDRSVHPNTQCEQVRQTTGNHMILARMTEAQADQLLAKLRREGAATH
jgi:phage recombination protein Bet